MADRINVVPAKTPETETPTATTDNTPGEAAEKKLEQVANRAAHKAAKTEQQYDEGHNTFSNI